MSYSVIILPQAEWDLNGILGWLHAQSPQAAARCYLCWEEVGDRLVLPPEEGQ